MKCEDCGKDIDYRLVEYARIVEQQNKMIESLRERKRNKKLIIREIKQVCPICKQREDEEKRQHESDFIIMKEKLLQYLKMYKEKYGDYPFKSQLQEKFGISYCILKKILEENKITILSQGERVEKQMEELNQIKDIKTENIGGITDAV